LISIPAYKEKRTRVPDGILMVPLSFFRRKKGLLDVSSSLSITRCLLKAKKKNEKNCCMSRVCGHATTIACSNVSQEDETEVVAAVVMLRRIFCASTKTRAVGRHSGR
jgi:hypothetical protein